MILETDLPGDVCVARRHYVNRIRQACRFYDGGHPGAVSRLPDYERSL